MKKTALFAAALLMCSLVGCSMQKDALAQTPEEISAVETLTEAETSPAAPITLTNHMTEKERSSVDVHALTLLDDPANAAHTVEAEIWTSADFIADLEQDHDYLTEEEYAGTIEWYQAHADEQFIRNILVDGCIYCDYIPEIGYDGGAIDMAYTEGEDDEVTSMHFDTMEEYFSWRKIQLQQEACEMQKGASYAEDGIRETKYVFDAVINGNYEVLPVGTVNPDDPDSYQWGNPFEDHRKEWEYQQDEVEAIRDSVQEISIYDEESDTDFLAHVILPPGYDPEQTYPVYFLTDAVWRFGTCPSLWQCMKNGEAAPVILVTLGFDYQMDGAADWVRMLYLVDEKDKTVDFITDNLMPYLGELYHIDYANSTLYGHSDGGVLTHYAAFTSDLHENQPFGRYIIGSPALWALYLWQAPDPDAALTDYGYFDRNERFDKEIFVTGGSQEDPDYASYYDTHDSTLEGIEHLKERMEAHGVTTAEFRMYDSHHYQYIPDMLAEYLREYYPVK
ncbi:MAG: hypothetical protein J5851_07285 [Oscillospiraceae bacterium]|nr:hypothetical protein [Oscillospiraceae bacterium]